jgi:hypothetical protein
MNRVVVLLVAACAVAIAVLLSACPPGTPVPPVVIDVATCVLDVISKDLLAGQSIEVAVADAAVKCFGSASAANKQAVRDLWSAHTAAMIRDRAIDGGT